MKTAIALLTFGILAAQSPSAAANFYEGFDNFAALNAAGWMVNNLSNPIGDNTEYPGSWAQGNPALLSINSQSGAENSFVAAGFGSGKGISTISNWLLSPELRLKNGDTLTFYTRTDDYSSTLPEDIFPDRLQLRLSINGASSEVGNNENSVGDFSILLLDINSDYQKSGDKSYPQAWRAYTVQLSNLPDNVTGRFGFRYLVENGASLGTNSWLIAIDSFSFKSESCNPKPLFNCNDGSFSSASLTASLSPDPAKMSPSKNSFGFKASVASTTQEIFGNPSITTLAGGASANTCVYDANGKLILDLLVAAGGVDEKGKPNWKHKVGKAKNINTYTNRLGNDDGVTNVTQVSGVKSQVQIKAKGDKLTIKASDFTSSGLTVQHIASSTLNDNQTCTATQFPANSIIIDTVKGSVKASLRP